MNTEKKNKIEKLVTEIYEMNRELAQIQVPIFSGNFEAIKASSIRYDLLRVLVKATEIELDKVINNE